jgi:hypothetical protein
MIALVPTCNRPELFARLVSKLEGFKVIGFVNNSTEENNRKYLNISLPENVRLVFTDIYGEPKACHVKTFKLMLKFATDECLVIEDDVLPCPEFYNQLVRRISVLNDHALNYTLSPILLPNRNSDFYTGNYSHEVKIGGYRFIDQAWVDGNFYMTASVLAAMKQWLSGRVKIYNASSGIGRLNSKQMALRKWKMYTSVPTLVEHSDQDSVMFGDRRKQTPLIASFGH